MLLRRKTALELKTHCCRLTCWQFILWTSLLLNKMLNQWNKKYQSSCWHPSWKVQDMWKQKTWKFFMLIRHVANHVANSQSLRQKRCCTDEILHVEVFHGSTRALTVCKVCGGCIYRLLAVGEAVRCFFQKLECGLCWTCNPTLCNPTVFRWCFSVSAEAYFVRCLQDWLLFVCILMMLKWFNATSCFVNRCFYSTCFVFLPVPILVAMPLPLEESVCILMFALLFSKSVTS